MIPLYKLAIIDANTDAILYSLHAGGRLERDLVAACTQAIVAKGVGLFRTEAQVKTAIETGIHEVIASLKDETRLLPK